MTGRDIEGGKAFRRSQQKEVSNGSEQENDTRASVTGNVMIPRRCEKQDICAWAFV